MKIPFQSIRYTLAMIILTISTLWGSDHVKVLDLLQHEATKNKIDLTKSGSEYIWRLTQGKKQVITLDLDKLGADPKKYDEIRFDILCEESLVSCNMALQGHLEPGQMSRWYSKFRIDPGQWSEGRYDIHLDDDGLSKDMAYHGVKRNIKQAKDIRTLELKLRPVVLGYPGEPRDRVVRIRNLRFVKKQLSVDFSHLETKVIDSDQEIGNIYHLKVKNLSGKRQDVELNPNYLKSLFHFSLDAPSKISIEAGEEKIIPVKLSMPRAKAMGMPQLYSEKSLFVASIPGMVDGDDRPTRGYRPWYLWVCIPIFEPFAWTPEVLKAHLKERPLFNNGVSRHRQGVLRKADHALAHNWPVPTHGPPDSDQAYRCPKCKAKKLKPTSPTELHVHKCQACGHDVKNDKAMDNHYVRIYHKSRAYDTEYLAWAWLLTGENKYADKAVTLLKAYAEKYDDLPTVGTRSTFAFSRIGGKSLGSSYATPHFAIGYELLRHFTGISKNDRSSIESMLRKMGVEVAQHCVGNGNQQAEHFHAYASCGVATGYWPLVAEALYGEFGFHRLVELGYDNDGIAPEGRAYHWSVLKVMTRMAEFFYSKGSNLYTRRFKRVYDTSLMMGMLQPGRSELEIPYRVYRDSNYISTNPKVRERRYFTGALYGVEGWPEKSAAQVKSSLFKSSGWVFLRKAHSGNVQEIRLNYIKQFDRHENDRLTTFFFRNGSQVDGTVARISYGIKNCWWMNHTHGHNCIVVDGKNSKPRPSHLVVYDPAPEAPLAMITTNEELPLYTGVQQTRIIALIGNAYVVFDRLDADKERTFDRYQWASRQIQVPESFKPMQDNPTLMSRLSKINSVMQGKAQKKTQLDFIQTNKKGHTRKGLRMALVSDKEMVPHVAKSWGGNKGLEMMVNFQRVEQSREVSFLAAFVLGDQALPELQILSSSQNSGSFEIKSEGMVHRVGWSLDKKSVKVTTK